MAAKTRKKKRSRVWFSYSEFLGKSIFWQLQLSEYSKYLIPLFYGYIVCLHLEYANALIMVLVALLCMKVKQIVWPVKMYAAPGKSYNLMCVQETPPLTTSETWINILMAICSSVVFNEVLCGQVGRSCWIIIVFCIWITMIDRFRRDSTIEIVSMLTCLLLAIFSIPGVMLRVLGAKQLVLQTGLVDSRVEDEKIGWNLLKMVIGYIPVFWIGLDNFYKPAKALITMNIHDQRDVKKIRVAIMYSGIWWIMIASEIFLSWLTDDIFTMMTMAIAGVITWPVWQKYNTMNW